MSMSARKIQVVARLVKHLAQHALEYALVIVRGYVVGFRSTRRPANDVEGFQLFAQLPADIRIKIWSLVTLNPSVIAMREAGKSDKTGETIPKYRFTRTIPAVLHACRESRYEFLDTNEEENGTALVRKRDHPTYKAYFTGVGHVSSPVLFSQEIDRMWGMICHWSVPIFYEYIDTNHESVIIECDYFGLTRLELTAKLERLDLYLDRNILGILPEFPSLKVLTFLVPIFIYESLEMDDQQNSGGTLVRPEVNGEINTEGLHSDVDDYIKSEREAIDFQLVPLINGNPEWTPPIILLRAVEQYVASECPEVVLNGHGWRKSKDSELQAKASLTNGLTAIED